MRRCRRRRNRCAARCATSTLQPSGLVCSNWGVTNAKNLALYGNTVGTGTLLIPGWQTSNISLDLPTSCSSTAAVGVIKMSATVPYSSLMWGIRPRAAQYHHHDRRASGEMDWPVA